MSSSRVLVVVNKWWECEPMLNALLHDEVVVGDTPSPRAVLRWPAELHHPRFRGNSKRPDAAGHTLPANPSHPAPGDRALLPEDPAPKPRAIFRLEHGTVEVWCISDLMDHEPDISARQSSSAVKKSNLGKIPFAEAALVVAVGTAAYPHQDNENGSVAIGGRVFMHDAHPEAQDGWKHDAFDTIIESSIEEKLFERLVGAASGSQARDRFLVPPLNPAPYGWVLARREYVALGTVNESDPARYAEADAKTLAAFARSGEVSAARSLETTHGLIRTGLPLDGGPAFIWISGIANRVGRFSTEVSPRKYAQNFVAAHNAGVALAFLLAEYDRQE